MSQLPPPKLSPEASAMIESLEKLLYPVRLEPWQQHVLAHQYVPPRRPQHGQQHLLGISVRQSPAVPPGKVILSNNVILFPRTPVPPEDPTPKRAPLRHRLQSLLRRLRSR